MSSHSTDITEAGQQPEPPTSEQLAAIRERLAAATPGPWCTDGWEIYQGAEYQVGAAWIGETCRAYDYDYALADAAFIAAARTDVRTLLGEVDRLRAERDAFADRVDTLTHVAKGNKANVVALITELTAAQRRIAELEAAQQLTAAALLDTAGGAQ